jgi:hypothetical protein
MLPFADWFPLIMVGGVFTTIGALKVYGFSHGIVGGRDKPASCRLMGSCPSWSWPINIGMTALFWIIGLACLAKLVWLAFHPAAQ